MKEEEIESLSIAINHVICDHFADTVDAREVCIACVSIMAGYIGGVIDPRARKILVDHIRRVLPEHVNRIAAQNEFLDREDGGHA